MSARWQIETDLNHISTVSEDGDLQGLSVACNSLRLNTESLQNYREPPVTAFRHQLAAGLLLYARSATDCLNGNITTSGEELRAGTVHINQATAVLTQLIG